MVVRNKKIRTGVVVSSKMDKTVIVLVERKIRHQKYLKAVRLSKRFKAHDEENRCVLGNKVKIIETRPISKEKCWSVLEIQG